VQEAVDRIWPDGIVEMPLDPDESYFIGLHPKLSRALRRIRNTRLVYEREADGGPVWWEESDPEEDPPDEIERSRSYHTFFVSPDGEGFTFETEAEGITEPEFMAAIAAKSVQSRAFQMLLLSAFALVALLLAAIGIHGVVAYAVLLRRKEIGVRIALGADPQHISRMVFQNGLTPVVVGLPIGLFAAGLFARLMSSLLFQVRALDPVTFIVAPLVLLVAAAAPCWLTARRAAHIDPMDCLRLE
jgi:hypothetical protein